MTQQRDGGKGKRRRRKIQKRGEKKKTENQRIFLNWPGDGAKWRTSVGVGSLKPVGQGVLWCNPFYK